MFYRLGSQELNSKALIENNKLNLSSGDLTYLLLNLCLGVN